MTHYDSPVLLITGAAGGIGQAFVDSFLPRPGILILSDIDENALASAYPRPEQGLHLVNHDVTSLASWRRTIGETVARFGRLDILVNLAGVVRPGYVYEFPLEEIDRHVDVNLKGVLYGMRLASEQMLAQGSGHIINVASLAGIAPVPGISLYSATKFAVRGYSLATALELRDKGVHVSVVCPGLVDTAMLDLQLAYDEAVITFSNGPALTPERVARVLLKVIDRKPVEAAVPGGLLPKITSAFPGLNRWLHRIMMARGKAAMARLRAQRAGPVARSGEVPE